MVETGGFTGLLAHADHHQVHGDPVGPDRGRKHKDRSVVHELFAKGMTRDSAAACLHEGMRSLEKHIGLGEVSR